MFRFVTLTIALAATVVATAPGGMPNARSDYAAGKKGAAVVTVVSNVLASPSATML